MSALEIALLVIIIGAFGSCIIGGTSFAFYISGKVSDVRTDLTVLESRLNTWSIMFEKFGRKALDIMHSPHTPELDSLIEKVQVRNDTDADWLRMLQIFTEMEKDQKLPKSERALAWGLVIMCKQRLKLPIDPEPHKHTETTDT